MQEKTRILEFSSAASSVPVVTEKIPKKNGDMILAGEDNMLPQYYAECLERSSFLSSLTDTMCTYIYGNGTIQNTDFLVNEYSMTYGELVYRLISDYIVYGAFALQVLRNAYGDIKKLVPLNVENVRLTSDGYVYYTHNKFKATSKPGKDLVKYEMFSPDNKYQRNSIYYFKDPAKRGFYGKPIWSSALSDIAILIAINEFNESSLANGFSASTVVSLTGGIPTPEEQKAIERQFSEKFSGSKNGCKFILTFSDSTDSAPKFEKLTFDGFTDQYVQLQETARNNLYVVFRMNPILTGLKTTEGVFNSEQYEDAFALYNTTVIMPMQKKISNALGKLGLDYQVDFKKFEVEWKK